MKLEETTNSKEALRVLAEQAVLKAAESDFALESFRYAAAWYDTERDRIITELPTFEETRAALGALPVVQERYGPAPDREAVWERLALQFIYGFLGNLSEPTFDPSSFETTWEAFWKELSEPKWTWLSLANLQNFHNESMLLDLGDGITIRGRSSEELARMSWSEWHLEQLNREWLDGGVNSAYVILTEHKLPKTPDNLVLTDTTGHEKATRALLALRLLKDGEIGISRMWHFRPASFNLGLGGYSATGYSAAFAIGQSTRLMNPNCRQCAICIARCCGTRARGEGHPSISISLSVPSQTSTSAEIGIALTLDW